VASSAELDALLARTTRPVMLDFYADWCVSCIEMERFTFSDPQVAARMARFQLVQADVTKNDADARALLKRFQLFGPPGIMFFDAHGKLIADARVVGFQNAREFSATLDRVLAGSGK
jgi:thiol:disulfide interchange protein DsbD